MKQHKCLVYKENNAENKIHLLEEPKKEHEIKIFDKNKTEITDYDLIPPDGQATITMKFQWKKVFEEAGAELVEYHLQRSNDWKIMKGGAVELKKGKKDEFNKAIKNIKKKLLKEKFGSDLFGTDKKLKLGSTNIQYGLTDKDNKIELHFYKENDITTTMHFAENQIDIEAKYLQPKEFTDSEGGEIIEKEENKTKLTPGWIAFFTIGGIIILLVIVFWKKIWRWIKGEPEQEKKVREQIDIF